MAHTIKEKKKLLNRVRRIRGQVEAIERALDQERDSDEILHLIAVCRGAMVSLMSRVIDGHIRLHLLDPHCRGSSAQSLAAEQLIGALRTCLR